VATSVLEEGIELPRCNLVVRYDPVTHFKSHANSKARARQQYAYYIVMMEKASAKKYLETYARFMLTEKVCFKEYVFLLHEDLPLV
jgi:endoribonuclease Dicer